MKANKHLLRAGVSAAVLLLWGFSAQAGKVTPPPLPPGSQMVTVEAGMTPAEEKRNERAHKNKSRYKKNYLVDDSVSSPGNSDSNGNGNAKKN